MVLQAIFRDNSQADILEDAAQRPAEIHIHDAIHTDTQ
jgi:hypothetical protein